MDHGLPPPDRIKDFLGALRASMESCREEWLADGRSTAPVDRPTAERMWREMYAALGLAPPVVIWFDGPAMAIPSRRLLAGSPDPLPAEERRRHLALDRHYELEWADVRDTACQGRSPPDV